MKLEELKVKLDRMSPTKVRFVAQVVEALERSPAATIKEQTWITRSAEWLEYFGLSLSLHHGATAEPLRTESFETVFRNACGAARWETDSRGSPTRRFVDLVVDPGTGLRRVSLKSTAARNLSETSAHISKLTEAAWIQDVRTAPKRRTRLLSLFREYQEAVDSIVMLRAFRQPREIPHRYQLIEIPTSIFQSLQRLRVEHFREDGPVLECRTKQGTVARVAIDRSDAKITIRAISLKACVVHAEWWCGEDEGGSSPEAVAP